MATVISGTGGITYPTTAGGTSSVQASSSKVLQVVQGTITGTISTTSTSDTSSGLSASITPSSSSSKIIVMVNGGKAYQGGGQQIICTVYRNGSTLGSVARYTPIEGSANGANHSLMYLDSPSSTSSITYTVYYRSSGGATAYFLDATSTFGQATLTLMEIAA